MKLHTDQHTVVGGNLGETTEATIKSTAKAFAILSSSLYSDKILAPIRELCCNAYDAMVAAGRKDVPIEVKLPSALDPVFSVRDTGLGLSEEQIRKLYLNYFDSTKTDSDEYIGALGLGSKSPLAYTSRFTVESRYNGESRVYSVFVNERGVPAVVDLSNEPTDEPNGLTVSFTVRKDDITKFNTAARKALMYFTPTPTVTGCYDFKPYAKVHGVAGSNWIVRKSEYNASMTGAYVIQGFVAYPIDVNMLKEHGLSDAAHMVGKSNLDLTVAIGEVEVAPSREALSYDDRTIKNLIGHLEVVAQEMRTAIQAEFDSCANLWTARVKYAYYTEDAGNAFKDVFSNLHQQAEFTYNGAKLTKRVKLDLTNVRASTVLSYYLSSRSRRRKLERTGQWSPGDSPVFHFDVQDGLMIVVDDIVKGSAQIIEQHMDALMAKTSRSSQRLLVIRPVIKSAYNEAEIDNIIAQFGGVAKVKLSSLDYQVVKRQTSYQKRAKGHCLKFTGFKDKSYGDRGVSRSYSRLTWQSEEVDFEAGGFYMPMHRFTPQHNGADVNSIDYVFSYAEQLGLIESDDLDVTYGFTEKDIALVKDDPDWVNLFDHLTERFLANIQSGRFVNGTALHAFCEGRNDGLMSFVSDDNWKEIKDQVQDGAFLDFVNVWRDIADASEHVRQDALKNLAVYLGINDKLRVAVTVVHQKLDGAWKDVMLEYPMLSMIGWASSFRSYNRQTLLDYIRTIDQLAATPAVQLRKVA